tara:strand:+ start:1401 stop:1844 length:444 start_codon:yes stop_codon:yes gene_type:complete
MKIVIEKKHFWVLACLTIVLSLAFLVYAATSKGENSANKFGHKSSDIDSGGSSVGFKLLGSGVIKTWTVTSAKTVHCNDIIFNSPTSADKVRIIGTLNYGAVSSWSQWVVRTEYSSGNEAKVCLDSGGNQYDSISYERVHWIAIEVS